MAVKRYVASQDTTITDAYKPNLISRAQTSNMGEADSLEVFSIYAQSSKASLDNIEKSRILVQFPIPAITSDRAAGDVPGSGSVNFFLRLFNVAHPFTVPSAYTLSVRPLSRRWEEGHGLDLDEYVDTGSANWWTASVGDAWTTAGGDFAAIGSTSMYFPGGLEDLSVDVTPFVERWIAGTNDNFGFGIHLEGSSEDGSLSASYYKKSFSARNSEYFFKRPIIEARWNSAITDDRSNFAESSSLMNGADNMNTLYLYNNIRGQLRDIPAVEDGIIYVNLFAPDGTQLSSSIQSPVTGGIVSTGIYSASFALDTSASVVNDSWFKGVQYASTGTEYMSGTFNPVDITASPARVNSVHTTTITNLKPTYAPNENTRFRVFSRDRDTYSPTIYSKAVAQVEPAILRNLFFKIDRQIDGFTAIGYGTGSTLHTKLSYDENGNYFDLDMSLLESGYGYEIKLLNLESGRYLELNESFKFRVD